MFIILSLFCYTYVLYIKSYYIQYTIVDSSEIYPQVCFISLAVGSALKLLSTTCVKESSPCTNGQQTEAERSKPLSRFLGSS